MNELDRFFAKVDKTDTCWIWTASLNHKGYGQFQSSTYGRPMLAYRFAYLMLVGEVPEGLVLDHICEVKACVNPQHLEPITNQENLIRGGVGQKNAEHHKSRTHCRNGHEYTEENTSYWNRKSRGVLTRRCNLCYTKQQEKFSKRTKG